VTEPTVLLVEDEKEIRRFVRQAFEAEGFRVAEAETLARGLIEAGTRRRDLVVRDLGLPDGDGVDLIRWPRTYSGAPVIVLSARSAEDDKVSALDAGADDYLAKPFEPRELVSRIRAILRRIPREPESARRAVRFGPFTFDLDRRSLRQGTADIRLTGAEADLLAQLAATPGAAVSRDTLGQSTSAESRMVDVQVTRLRRKIETDPRFPRYLVTVRGRGYMLQTD
jgi:two-component system KDP operon response regulator KdpE